MWLTVPTSQVMLVFLRFSLHPEYVDWPTDFSTRNINSGDNGNTNSLSMDTFWTNGYLTRFGVRTQRYANEKNLAVVPQGGNTGWEAAQGFLKGAMVWVVPLLDGWFHHL